MSLWDSIPIPGIEFELKSPSEWDFFTLAGLLLSQCQAKYSVEQQRKVGLAMRGMIEVCSRTEKSKADARALWAVRVLDAAGRRDKRCYAAHPVVKMNGYWSVVLGPNRDITRGEADDARIDAAKLLYPDLPEAVRRELGECPT